MTDPTLPALIAALEAATEDSQEFLILRAIEYAKNAGWITPRKAADAVQMLMARAYESAALGLVPEERYWIVGYGRDRPEEPLGGATIFPGGAGRRVGEAISDGEAATPAIALVIAALRAREAGDA